ncbi:LacI family DNA-binding transcriptional regulator [Paenibacillus lentus]|uniref:LacI family transcriptional regulator n=1 Tax=Paenibacillus lentus TaxID=1338368 RepID=A0A3S8RVN0_9BACL|nr:LacI family DNA-binding transcriptional regulator [Paenibacillus lentus]AZK46932.1 LacI family transcriptional regulator [Paenibacillus lentus]
MARRKRVSMQDIADKLEISKNAVSLALTNKKGVSDELRSRIIHTAKEMGYGPYAISESGESNILVLVPERIMSYQDNDHFQFFHDMIWGLEKSIRSKGFNAVIAPIDRESEHRLQLPRLFTDISYRGIILFGITHPEYARVVWEQEVRLVMMDSYYRELPCPVVTSANMEGAYEAVSYLIDCGHKDIGFIGPVNLTTSHEERWLGYWKAMQSGGLKIRGENCLTSSAGYDYTAEEITSFLSGLSELPSAFFCSNDRIAFILAELLQERNIAVPEELSIVGYDDLQYDSSSGVNMTTMRVEKERMCDAAATLLLSLNEPSREAIRWSVAPTLLVRSSVQMKGD